MCYLEPVSVEISQHGVEKIPHFLYIPFFLCVESDNEVDEVHHKLFLYCRCKCSKRKRINKIYSEKSIHRIGLQNKSKRQGGNWLKRLKYKRCIFLKELIFGLSNILAASRQGLFFIPLIIILPRCFGLLGVEICQAVSDLFSLIVTIPIVWTAFREMK